MEKHATTQLALLALTLAVGACEGATFSTDTGPSVDAGAMDSALPIDASTDAGAPAQDAGADVEPPMDAASNIDAAVGNDLLEYTATMMPGEIRTIPLGVARPAGGIFDYTQNAYYDRGSRKAYYLNRSHGQPWYFFAWRVDAPEIEPLSLPFEDIYTWTQEEAPLEKELNEGSMDVGGHAYDDQAIDGENGVLYWFNVAGELHRYRIADGVWDTLPNDGDVPTRLAHGMALEYFPPTNSLIQFRDGLLSRYSLETNTWSTIGDYPTGAGYNHMMEYSAGCECVLFGGGNGSESAFVLHSSGRVDAMDAAPEELTANNAILSADHGAGTFILRSTTAYHRADPSTGAWSTITSDVMRFPNVYADGRPHAVGHYMVGVSDIALGAALFYAYDQNTVEIYKFAE